MIPYEELDRALARWKARAQGAANGVVEAEPPPAPAPILDGADAELDYDAASATPLPIPSEELGSIPNVAAPGTERTGELTVDELESYEDEDA